jgi:hypothetical protein
MYIRIFIFVSPAKLNPFAGTGLTVLDIFPQAVHATQSRLIFSA